MIAVENQFGASNHDHLGKLLVYFSNQDAKIGVWICEEAKPEHIKSVQWLNERSEDEDFFLLETKVIRIGDSHPAIDFDIIVGPKGFREIGKERRKAKGMESEWTSALEEIGEEFQKLKPAIILGRPRGTYRKILTGFGGIHFEWHIFGKQEAKYLEVALHVETTDRDTNQSWIDGLLPFREELEKLFKEEVHFGAWSEKSRGGRWRKISIKRKFGKKLNDKTKAWAVESMAKLYEFLTPRLKEVAP